MTTEERETLSVGLAHGHSLRTMARVGGRAPSTVSRESARNAMRGRPYRACPAHTLATVREPVSPGAPASSWTPGGGTMCRQRWLRAARPNRLLDASDARSLLIWGDRSRQRPSYGGLSVLPRGALRSELLAALRQARKTRRPRARGIDRRGQIPNMTPIAECPAAVATRTVAGHGEGALIKGARNGSAVGTLVERTTRLVILARMEGTDATSARQGFTKKLRHVPTLLRKTLPYDRGKERAEQAQLAQRLAIRVFFADPYSVHGHAAPTRTRRGCCASPGPRAWTCRATPNGSCTPSRIG
jgi:transposase, IS30 family